MISRASKVLYKAVFVLIIGFVWQSCSNTKDGFLSRTGHNLSAHYNGYYNAGLKLEEGLDKLALSHVDHYDRILSVFQYADAAKAKAIYPQLEDAMKRVSTVITRHTIIDKRGNEKPESEKWIDENWVLYGKCQFFHHDYFEAMETFKYVEATYKKQTGRHIASLWIAKTYLQLTQLREAEGKLDYVRNQADFPKSDLWELNAVNADYYLQTRNYEKAAEYLTKAVAQVHDREKKIRWRFILAQLHQQKGENKKAFDLYTKVIKMNPPYEMAFNSRLNRARCYDASSGSSETVKKELLKMERDPKNHDFLDQIYYALAGLSKNEGNQDDQIKYLNMSVRASTTNVNQKALAYLELGKIAFVKPDYREAQAYYDSTISNIETDYPDYTDILNRRNSLTKLIKYMKTIETEDSLQAIAKLPGMERMRIVNEALASEEEAEKKAKEASDQQQSNQIFGQSNSTEANSFNTQSGSNWYFYNAQAMSFGLNEFIKKFGDRKLEDNWRRIKKEATGAAPIEPGGEVVKQEEQVDTAGAAIEVSKREKMMKSIPVTEEQKEKSTNKIVEAYYSIGLIYREQLQDLKAAAATFEELIKRYPTCKYELQCYFQLYRIYQTLGETAKSDYYKNKILNEHPDTEYAKIIRDPNYLANKAQEKSQLEIFYEDTYRKYLNGEYADVIARKGQADVQFPQNAYVPKFDLLRTLAIGRTQPLPVFEASLNDIMKNYANDSIAEVAQQILDYIHDTKNVPPPVGDAPVSGFDTSKANAKLYTYLPDTTHFVILIFQNIGGPLNPERVKNRLTDFNSANFGSKGITIQDFLFDHRYKIFIVKNFSNKSDALQYTAAVYDNDNIFGNVNHDAYRLYAISVNNLPTLLGQKKTDDYEDFYRGLYQ
jgi:tetratricopeptide (TPR) repeat protein